MTHTLHREGDRESLRDDYVVLGMPAAGINSDGSVEAIRTFLDLASEYDTVNLGSMDVGSINRYDFEELIAGSEDGSIVHAVFADFEEFVDFFDALDEMDLGLSIVVSGVFERTAQACKRVSGASSNTNPDPHTVRYALGIRGDRDRLPDEWNRELITMCGHGMVSADLVDEMAAAVAEGRLQAEKAAERLARPCSCGIFNTQRAERLLAERAESSA